MVADRRLLVKVQQLLRAFPDSGLQGFVDLLERQFAGAQGVVDLLGIICAGGQLLRGIGHRQGHFLGFLEVDLRRHERFARDQVLGRAGQSRHRF